MRKISVILILVLSLIIACAQQPAIPKEPTTPAGVPAEEPKETCTTGWKCLDQNRKGYQFSNCVFAQVNQCKYGCKDGECLPALPEEDKQQTFSLIKGIGRIKEVGWKSSDFSEQQIFLDGVADQDFKIMLYPRVLGYNYFTVESQGPSIWIINKKIADTTREDCMEKISDAGTFNYLRTEQTLCVKTKENNIALVGGYWDGAPSENTRLNWKYFS